MTSHFLPVYFFLYFSSFSFFLFFFRFSIFPEEAEREWKSTGYRSQQRALFLSGLILNAKDTPASWGCVKAGLLWRSGVDKSIDRSR